MGGQEKKGQRSYAEPLFIKSMSSTFRMVNTFELEKCSQTCSVRTREHALTHYFYSCVHFNLACEHTLI